MFIGYLAIVLCEVSMQCFFLLKALLVSDYVCVCVHMFRFMSVGIHVCGGQRSAWGVIYSGASTLLGRRSLTWLGVHCSVRLLGQEVPGVSRFCISIIRIAHMSHHS